MREYFAKSRLDNGIRVITDRLEGRLSVSIGVWTLSGSRHDPKNMPGLAHLIEHMLFKGTENYSSRQISEIIEYKGGSIDGYTDYDVTAIMLKLLSDEIPTGIKIISEMINRPLIDSKMLESEKKVILEEITADRDDNNSMSFNNLSRIMWQNYPLSHEILGNPESIARIMPNDIRQYLDRYYSPQRTLISAVGNVCHDDFLDMIENAFSNIPKMANIPQAEEPVLNELQTLNLVKDNILQAMVYVVIPIGNIDTKDRYGYSLMTSALGSGSASRLFQKLREEHSLAYSTGAWMENFADQSFIICYADTNENGAKPAIDMILAELDDIMKNGMGKKELGRMKNTIAGKLALSTESTSSMLQRLMTNEIILGNHITIEQSIENFRNFPKDRIQELANKKFNKDNILLFGYGNIPENINIKGFRRIWHQKK
ncbi:MAG: M16 family metallopeptidase [Candidatus Zixiibacteriota bacterium]